MKIFIQIYPYQNYITLGIVYLWLNFFPLFLHICVKYIGAMVIILYSLVVTTLCHFFLFVIFYPQIIFLIVLSVYLEPVNKWQRKVYHTCVQKRFV